MLKYLIAVLAMAVGISYTGAQISNGDFSAGTNGWSYFFPSSNRLIPEYGITQIDIDGSGPLSNSPAFYANVGEDALLDLQQNVLLSGPATYNFHADLASIPYGFNADGGTISVFVGQSNIASYSFGSFTSISPKYASMAASFSPGITGLQLLSIDFSRGFGFGGVGDTPTDVIDNISLTPVLVPLQMRLAGNTIVFTWTNSAYALQAASSFNGPYTNVPTATSPFTNTLDGSAGFFRLLGN